MRTIVKTTVFSVFVLGVVSLAYGAIINGSPTALSNGSDIVVRWVTDNESGVQRFEILRRGGTVGDFAFVSAVSPKGNRSSYEYVDSQAFKSQSGVYQYRIRIINGEVPSPQTEIITVTHLTSAAKRTWGSIKAMFR